MFSKAGMRKLFVGFCTFVLLSAGALKLIEIFRNPSFGLSLDPVTGIRSRDLLLTASLVEMSVGLSFLLGRFSEWKMGMLFWLSLSFGLYHAARFILRVPEECDCAGGLLTRFPTMAPYFPITLWLLVVSMIVGSGYFFLDVVVGRNRKG